ncbi:hypothetical protein GGD62_008010 [Bradyrhizobium sp. ERR14]|nr:hypothetical protein [Bradyrhizobium sp. ERR14]
MGRIGPRLGQRFISRWRDVITMLRFSGDSSGQAIERGDNNRFAGSEGLQQPLQLTPVVLGTALPFLQNTRSQPAARNWASWISDSWPPVLTRS